MFSILVHPSCWGSTIYDRGGPAGPITRPWICGSSVVIHTSVSSGICASSRTLCLLLKLHCCLSLKSLFFDQNISKKDHSGIRSLSDWGIGVLNFFPMHSSAGDSPHQGRGVVQ